jgi:uncharacterized protein YaiL (DUF2058 family)
MGNSLFDQLKKSGLIDEKKANKLKREKHKLAKQQKSKQSKPQAESRQRAQQAQAEKAQRDRELNHKRKKAVEEREIAAQIKQLIEMNRIEVGAGDIGFNFTDGNEVQRLHVTKQLQDQLASGHLAIVKLDANYALVPSPVAEKISHRDPAHVILSNARQPEDSNAEDPYEEFKVPDDLMW